MRVTVSARSAEYTPYDLSYPLIVRASGGNWFVAAIQAVPELADSAPEPPTPVPLAGETGTNTPRIRRSHRMGTTSIVADCGIASVQSLYVIAEHRNR